MRSKTGGGNGLGTRLSNGTVFAKGTSESYNILHCTHALTMSWFSPTLSCSGEECPSWRMVLQAGTFWPAVGLRPPPSTSTPPLTLCSTGEGTSPPRAPPPGTGELAMPPTSGQGYTTVLNWTRWTIPQWGEEDYRSQPMQHLAEHIEQVILVLCRDALSSKSVLRLLMCLQ